MAQLTDQQINKFSKLFKEFDKDGSGSVSAAEVQTIMTKFGVKLSIEQINGLVVLVDADLSGEIELDEFLELIRLALNPQELAKKKEEKAAADELAKAQGAKLTDKQRAKFIKLFKEFDKDGSGSVSAPEVQAIMSKFGIKLSIEQINGLIELVDADFSGEIELDEFLELIRLALNPGEVTRKKAEKAASEKISKSLAEANVPKEPQVKSRSFNLEPEPEEGPLPVALELNAEAQGFVDITGPLPLTLKNKLPLTSPCRPFSFALRQELSGGTFKILLISQLYAPAWGRWAGVVRPQNIGLKEYHIVGNNTLDHDAVQISTLGVKSGGVWRYRKAEYVEPAGRVEFALEFQANAGKLLGTWNGQTLPYGVKNIPQGVHFTFELPNSLELTIVSLQRLQNPTIKPLPGYTEYEF